MTTILDRPAPATPAASASRGGSTLTGTWSLVRFILRRDRVRLTVWTLSLVAFYAYFTAALGLMAETDGMLASRATLMETPAGIAMGGPGYGVDDYTVGAAIANEGTTWVVIALALMSILHMVRHTRAEEESSRSELVRATVVGRHAPAVAAVITLVLVNVVIAVVSALAMTGTGGADEMPFVDALAMALACALSAMVFGAIALVLCQVSERGRGASGLSLAVFGVAFAVQVAGNLQDPPGGSPLSWFSPIAWAQQVRAFVDLRWWPMALSIVAILLLLWLAAVLASHRDFGGGMLAGRKGRADAKASLRGPFALAWTQQRMALLWSCLGLGIMWALTGTLIPDIGDMVSDLVAENPVAGALFGDDPSSLTVGFLGVMILFSVLCAVAYAIVMAARPKGEEAAGRVEVTLARPVSRSRWLGAQAGVATLGTVVLTAVSVYAMWVGAVAVGESEPTFGEYSVVFATYVPAVLVYLGLAVALYGWAPRLTGLAWALFAYSFLVDFFGPMIEDVPDGAYYPSPLYWVPEAFTEDFDAAKFLGLLVVAAVLYVLAFVGFRRRDLVTN